MLRERAQRADRRGIDFPVDGGKDLSLSLSSRCGRDLCAGFGTSKEAYRLDWSVRPADGDDGDDTPAFRARAARNETHQTVPLSESSYVQRERERKREREIREREIRERERLPSLGIMYVLGVSPSPSSLGERTSRAQAYAARWRRLCGVFPETRAPCFSNTHSRDAVTNETRTGVDAQAAAGVDAQVAVEKFQLLLHEMIQVQAVMDSLE